MHKTTPSHTDKVKDAGKIVCSWTVGVGGLITSFATLVAFLSQASNNTLKLVAILTATVGGALGLLLGGVRAGENNSQNTPKK